MNTTEKTKTQVEISLFKHSQSRMQNMKPHSSKNIRNQWNQVQKFIRINQVVRN